MMKLFSNIIKIVFFALVITLITFISSMYLYPEKTSQIVGFRFYTVLTDSMEPTIPTYSLILTKVIPEDKEVKPNTIVTFKADRFGEDVLITHYFRKTQEKDGIMYYRTQPEGKDINDISTYDNYETKRSDIIGTYLFHVPYVGKIVLFLQSKFGFIMYAELFIIFLINKLIKTRWEEKQEKNQKLQDEKDQEQYVVEHTSSLEIHNDIEPEMVNEASVPPEEVVIDQHDIYLSDISFRQEGHRCTVEGFVHNESNQVISAIPIQMTLFDVHCVMAKHTLIEVAKEINIQPGNVHRFIYECGVTQEIGECMMYIIRNVQE